ncbi:MAG: glycoside hydrolase family 75 protein, partial [Verrucomicrobiota bacterium]
YAERGINKAKRIAGITPPKTEQKSPQPAKKPPLPPLPEKFFPTARMEFTNLPGGIKNKLDLKSAQGGLATEERPDLGSYFVETSFTVRVPRAATSLEDLSSALPEIAELWPKLQELLPSARISPSYHSLYERKMTFLHQRLKAFRDYPTKHNFFDCQTILELTSPESQNPLLLVQADMDVVTDGSDGDRVDSEAEIDNTSRHYQPFTAYSWAKTTKKPNPLLTRYQAELDTILAELERESGVLSESDKMRRYERRNSLKKIIEAMKYRSSLVAHLDPFIVLPGFMFKAAGRYAPKMGDYAIVLYGEEAYPAIIGDSGPYSKIGEASLLLAQTLNPEANGVTRSVSKPGVTYLIFPQSRETKFSAPDLDLWRQRCQELIQPFGGLSVPLYDWNSNRSLEKIENDPTELNDAEVSQ